MATGLTAVLADYAVGTVLAGRPGWGWLLLSIPAAIAMILVPAWWPLLRAAVSAMAGPLHLNGLRRQRGRTWRPARRVAAATGGKLLRTPSRTLLGGFVIALACAALSLDLAAHWAFRGAAQSWAGRSVSWEGQVVEVATVLIIVTMVTLTVADLNWVTARERTAEFRTLRAIGWSARDVTRLTLRNAVRLGLAGGLAAGAGDLVGGIAVSGSVPPRMIAVAAVAAAAGVAMSLFAVGISAALSRSRPWEEMNCSPTVRPFFSYGAGA
jgi:putative ABC transport system permease protein